MAKISPRDLATNRLARQLFVKLAVIQHDMSEEDVARRAHNLARAFVAGCIGISDGADPVGDAELIDATGDDPLPPPETRSDEKSQVPSSP